MHSPKLKKRHARQVNAEIDRFLQSLESPEQTINGLRAELETREQQIRRFKIAWKTFETDYFGAEKDEGLVIEELIRAVRKLFEVK